MTSGEGVLKLGVLASGSGTNLQAIIDACRDGALNAQVSIIVSNNSKSGALERGRRHRIPTVHLSSTTHRNPQQLDGAMYEALSGHGTDIVLLAGYMKKLGSQTLSGFKNRILNIHPALLPDFGGRGMYGMYVHEAVLAAGSKKSGVTIHLVDERYDKGPILSQRSVPVLDSDTADTLQKRVLAIEHTLYVETLQNLQNKKITIVDELGPLIIRPISEDWEVGRAVDVIRRAFKPVAHRYNLTRENCPTHPSFIELGRLLKTMEVGGRLFSCFERNTQIGFCALEKSRDDAGIYYLERLCVLPEYCGRGIGSTLIDYCCEQARLLGAGKISIGIIDAHKELKAWYLRRGFRQTGTRSFKHLPFTVRFMERIV